ncbi:MAG TPA: hypothetical protein PKK74_09310 [Candidatus Methanoculleus thermohydrogenotrophicum]|jgi:hypothetical protein|nr:hypothetical protein [Candidatus Methanoculleus thermohydrogenotrophicum]NLM82382.1 hypothetical protein [Candidatus Methanoculleus thermohydrogenotrophicum]HOB18870.1 hypothetical protein [Candidatus Methanoculleus thermohydrogenotrophicum]HPZ38624.1 hypothetical protein [Candidatus Methanoculleus thermohydrogenotrophicum]HQC91779.1 hypothetical protein [Candidatus Methanoculleus thermohydrogenotrophicum]
MIRCVGSRFSHSPGADRKWRDGAREDRTPWPITMTKWAIENLSIGEAPVVMVKRQAIRMQKEGVKRQGNRVGARDREDLHQTSGR